MTPQNVATRLLKQCVQVWRYLCWHVNMLFRKSVTVSTKQGVFTIYLASHEFVGKSLYCYREFELDMMANSLSFLRSIEQCPPKGQGTVVDIGANNGVSSIGMLYTGEFEKAIAIEPEPRNFSLLQTNVSQNGMDDRIVTLPFAASDQKGEIQFELSHDNFGDHRVRTSSDDVVVASDELYRESKRRVISVPTDQLDNLLDYLPESFTQDIALVWIDVQGFERYAFTGAKNLLSTGIPVVAEIWPYGLRRAGTSKEQYCEIASGFWTRYWVWRDEEYIQHPIENLGSLIDELGYDRNHINIIFTR